MHAYRDSGRGATYFSSKLTACSQPDRRKQWDRCLISIASIEFEQRNNVTTKCFTHYSTEGCSSIGSDLYAAHTKHTCVVYTNRWRYIITCIAMWVRLSVFSFQPAFFFFLHSFQFQFCQTREFAVNLKDSAWGLQNDTRLILFRRQHVRAVVSDNPHYGILAKWCTRLDGKRQQHSIRPRIRAEIFCKNGRHRARNGIQREYYSCAR